MTIPDQQKSQTQEILARALYAADGQDGDLLEDGTQAIEAYFCAADAILSALSSAGLKVVGREPSLLMLLDGHEAARRVRSSGVSGMTVEAQTKAECARECAAWRAMWDTADLDGAAK